MSWTSHEGKSRGLVILATGILGYYKNSAVRKRIEVKVEIPTSTRFKKVKALLDSRVDLNLVLNIVTT